MNKLLNGELTCGPPVSFFSAVASYCRSNGSRNQSTHAESSQFWKAASTHSTPIVCSALSMLIVERSSSVQCTMSGMSLHESQLQNQSNEFFENCRALKNNVNF